MSLKEQYANDIDDDRNEHRHARHEHHDAPREMFPGDPQPDEPDRTRIPFKPFPLDCLCATLARYAAQVAESIGCCASMVAVPMLSVIGAAIGASRLVEVKPGFTQPAILWTGNIAESGAGKSPAFGAAVGPYYRLEASHHDLHTEDCERIRQAHENLHGDDKSDPEFPPLPRFVIGDTTIEALAPVLQQNPQGLLLSADELSGWLASFNQYKGKGADRSHWLNLYDGARLTIDRKTGPVKLIIVPNGIVSVTGGIQPGVLRRALSDDDFDSGLPARFVFTMPPDRPLGWSDVPRPSDDDYAAILKRISDARGETITVPLSDEARELYATFKNEDTTRLRGVSGPLRAAWAKSAGRAARLALILHESDGTGELSISADTMARAIRLSRWFDRETERIYAALGISRSVDVELLEFIRSRYEVTTRDLQQWKRSRYPTADAAERDLSRLADDGLLIRTTDDATGGRPRTAFRWNPPQNT